MVNPFWLTFAALLMTLRGDVPLETWFPLFEDFGMMLLDKVMNIMEVLM